MKFKLKLPKNTKRLLALFILLPCLLLVIAVVTQPQRVKQFAQETFSSPPLFGCLQVGEGSPETCGSRLGKIVERTLTLYGRPVNKQTVYYGDRVKASLTFESVGDLPLLVNNLGIIAQSKQQEDYFGVFQPLRGKINLNPKENTTLSNASYRFLSPDPNGEWSVGTWVIGSEGQKLSLDEQKMKFTVNATCTALRAKELTDKDKTNLKSLCAKTPKSKLCSSRQYCEIMNGDGCNQKNVSEETPQWQCDEYVYLPKTEQDLLEEFCKVYPDTDACKDFCKRTADTALCPPKYLVISAMTGKPLTMNHDAVLYVRDPDNLKFSYSDKYPDTRVRLDRQTPPKAVAGVKIALQCPAGQVESGGGPTTNMCIPAPVIRSTGTNGRSTAPGANVNQGGKCTPGAPGCPLTGVSAPVPRTPAGTPSQATTSPTMCSGPPCLPATPGLKAGACGLPGLPSCPMEKNVTPYAPGVEKQGLYMDPDTCNPNGTAKAPAKVCLTVSNPYNAQKGDPGFAPECASKRREINRFDDPADVEQASCCANTIRGRIMLREGCCGQLCTVWFQQVKADGSVELRDGKNRVCANGANEVAKAIQTNTCGPNRTRANTIPPELQGKGGVNPDVVPNGGQSKQDSDPPTKFGTTPNGQNCSLPSDCRSTYCNESNKCANPPNSCYGENVATNIVTQCCSGKYSGGKCVGPNLHPYDVPLGADGLPLTPYVPPAVQPQPVAPQTSEKREYMHVEPAATDECGGTSGRTCEVTGYTDCVKSENGFNKCAKPLSAPQQQVSKERQICLDGAKTQFGTCTNDCSFRKSAFNTDLNQCKKECSTKQTEAEAKCPAL